MTDRMKKVIFTAKAKPVTHPYCKDDFDTFEEAELNERLTALQEQHKVMLENDADYAALFYSLPDRSAMQTDMPLNERVVVPTLQLLRHIMKVTRCKKEWSEKGNALSASQAAAKRAAKARQASADNGKSE